MRERQLQRARMLSSVAATAISLACGTNYVYSAWAPQFADKLHYSATQANLVGLAGNLGMYSMGVPIGLFIDHRGPRPAVIVGALLLALGYFPIQAAYDRGEGSVGLMCFFSFLSGLGGCMAFAAAIKTSALNWPHHRGTATAFPLAAFGLSAFFFSLIGGIAFSGNTSAFLALLAVGTSGMTFIGFFFLRVYPHHVTYQAVSSVEDGCDLSDSQQLHRTTSEEGKVHRGGKGAASIFEPGTSPDIDTNYTNPTASSTQRQEVDLAAALEHREPSGMEPDVESSITAASPTLDDHASDETSSLMSKSSSLPGDVLVANSVDLDRSHRVDIRGWKLLSNIDFWQQFLIMGILAGIGLMTINNIGHDVNALWKRYDDTVTEEFLIYRQQIHVSILSICSFAGRLSSGVGSDFLVKVLHASRVWCLIIASVVFCIAQVCALNITNPHLLGFVSGLSGVGYGFLFGVFPSIVAETFGIHGLSQNWGLMTLSPVISGNVFNVFYGVVFDRHSVVGPDGERSCPDGLDCYRSAYFVTLGACGLGLLVTLWTIRHQHLVRLREAKIGPPE